MKVQWLFILILPFILLTGCSKQNQNMEIWKQFSQAATEAKTISFVADVTADYGSKSFSYTLSYKEQDGNGEIEVLAPEMIQGITAKITDDQVSIAYDTLLLDTGALDGHGTTPVSGMPQITQAVLTGHVETLSIEKNDGAETLLADITLSEDQRLMLWISPDTLSLERAEICTDGKVILFCSVSDWTLS